MEHQTTSPVVRANEAATSNRTSSIPELKRAPFPSSGDPEASGVVVSTRRRNRPVVRRRVSPLKVLVFLFGAAVAIVLYIGNVIAVGNLLFEINTLEHHENQLLMEQERLRFEIRQLSSLERIRGKAESELGLSVVRDAPTWLTVDREKIRTLEQNAGQETP